MKYFIKCTSVLLVLVLLCGLLSSCKKKNDNGDTETTADTVSADTSVDMSYKDELPSLDYEKAQINLLCSTKQGVHDEFYAADNATTKIEQAVYKRNLEVEARLGIKLNILTDTATEEDTINKKLSTAVQAGDQSYDIVSSATYVAARYVIQSNYRNIKGCEYLNLGKGYWSDGFNEAFSYGSDKQYLATGSAVISIYRLLYVTIYNKQMFLDAGEKDLYDVVKSNKWTIEYQNQIISHFANDTGDPDTSTYGLSTGKKISVDPYWVSFNCQIVSKDADNHFKLNTDKTSIAKVSDAVDKILKLYGDSATMAYDTKEDGFTTPSKAIDPFCDSRAAMATTLINTMELYIDKLASIEYGIVPMPKFDEGQDAYYSAVMDQVSSLGVSATVDDGRLQMMGAVLECLASESYKNVVGVYYDEILNYRYLQDVQSQEMLKLTYEGSGMAMAAIYTGVLLKDIGFTTMMRNFIVGGVNTVSSTFRGNNNQLTTGVANLNKAFDDIST